MRVLCLCMLIVSAAPVSAQTRYEWVGGASGAWSEPTNWSPVGVPAVADTAVVGEVDQGERIATLTANTTVAGLEIVRLGVVAGDFDLAVTDRFVWSGGGSGFETLRGAGTVSVGPAATLFMTEPTTRFQVGAGRTLVNDGTAVWEGAGSWRGQGRFVNNGEVILSFGGTDTFGFVFSSLADAFTNTTTGVIRRTGSGNARYNAGLVNDGLVRVEAGSLDLRGFNSNGTTGGGAIEVEPGGTLFVGASNHDQVDVTGDAVTFADGTGRLTVTGSYDVTTTRFESGNGRLVLDTDGTTDTLFMESGFIDGSGVLTVTGSFDWSGGRMEGGGTTTLGPSVSLVIGGANVSLGGTRTLRTEGPVTWTGEADLSSGTSTTVFENAGTLTSSGAGERRASFLTFRNAGTIVHAGGTLDFATRMDNEGEVRAEGGALRLRSTGSVDTGCYVVAEDGLLSIAGSRTLTETASIEGTGTVVFENGANVANRATWRPGASPGVLAIDSDWPAPASESVLEIEIGGAAPGTEFDQLAVTGSATLGGTLRAVLADGFEPADGDRFLIVPAASVAGAFDAFDLPDGLDAFVETVEGGAELVVGIPVANEPEATVPTTFALHPGYPNPFAEEATLAYDLPGAEGVRLVLYDVLGRRVAVLVDGEQTAGRHEVTLRAGDWPSGVYVARFTAGDFAQARRLTILR